VLAFVLRKSVEELRDICVESDAIPPPCQGSPAHRTGGYWDSGYFQKCDVYCTVRPLERITGRARSG
jgi:hypothetical protein